MKFEIVEPTRRSTINEWLEVNAVWIIFLLKINNCELSKWNIIWISLVDLGGFGLRIVLSHANELWPIRFLIGYLF